MWRSTPILKTVATTTTEITITTTTTAGTTEGSLSELRVCDWTLANSPTSVNTLKKASSAEFDGWFGWSARRRAAKPVELTAGGIQGTLKRLFHRRRGFHWGR